MKVLIRSPLFWLIVLTALLYVWVVVPYWKPTWDSATYISLARALVQGEGYSYMGYPHTKYPPGFPLLLAPIELFFGHHYLLMRALIAACAVASIGFGYLLLRHLTTASVAWLVSIATATCYALVFEATRILSDVPYMLASLAALYVIEHTRERLNRRNAGMILALLVAAYLIRIIGFTLLLALLCELLWDRRELSWKQRLRYTIAFGLSFGIVVGLWMGRNVAVNKHLPAELREALSYERELIVVDPNNPHSPTVRWSDLGPRLRRNVVYYEQLLVNLLTARQVQGGMAMHWISVFWLIGWAIALATRRSVMDYYVFFYAWVYLLWPSWQGERFLVPILPAIFYYVLQPVLLLFRGCAWVEQEARKGPRFHFLHSADVPCISMVGRMMRSVEPVALTLILVGMLELGFPDVLAMIRSERQEPYYRGAVGEYIAAIEWIRDHTPEDAVIITDRAPWCYLLSGRKTFTAPRVSGAEEILASMRRNGATHVLANSWGFVGTYLLPVIADHPEWFQMLHQIGDNRIYRTRWNASP